MLVILNAFALILAAGLVVALHLACYALGLAGLERMLQSMHPAPWVVVAAGVSLEVGKGIFAFWTGRLIAARSYGAALTTGLLAALCVLFSAASDFSSATHGLAENGRQGQSQMDTRTGLLAELRAAEAQREVMSRPAPPRPSTVVEAEIAGARVPAWALRETDGCRGVLTDSKLIAACRPLTALFVELAQAQGYEKLTERVTALRTRVEAIGIVATTDPIVAFVERVAAHFQIKISGADVIAILVVFLLQLGSLSGFSLVAAMYRSMMRSAQVAAAPKAGGEIAPAQVADATAEKFTVDDVSPREAITGTPTPSPAAPQPTLQTLPTSHLQRHAKGGSNVSPAAANVIQLKSRNGGPQGHLRGGSTMTCSATSGDTLSGPVVEGTMALAPAHPATPSAPPPQTSSAPSPPPSGGASPDTSVAEFIASRLIPKTGSVATATDIWGDYVTWCEERGTEPVSRTRFGTTLTEVGFEKWKSNGRTVYRDVELFA